MKTVADFPAPQVFNKDEAKDIDALEWIMPKEAKVHKFPNQVTAMGFIARCIAAVPPKLGAIVPANIPQELVNPLLKGYGITHKKQTFPLKTDFWRNGWYFYQNGELRFFISFPMLYMGKMSMGGKVVMAKDTEYHVRTNVVVE